MSDGFTHQIQFRTIIIEQHTNRRNVTTHLRNDRDRDFIKGGGADVVGCGEGVGVDVVAYSTQNIQRGAVVVEQHLYRSSLLRGKRERYFIKGGGADVVGCGEGVGVDVVA